MGAHEIGSGWKNRTRCFLRHMRARSENEVNSSVFKTSRAHWNPKRVVLQRLEKQVAAVTSTSCDHL